MSGCTQDVFNMIHSAEKVVIAAISGLALGGRLRASTFLRHKNSG